MSGRRQARSSSASSSGSSSRSSSAESRRSRSLSPAGKRDVRKMRKEIQKAERSLRKSREKTPDSGNEWTQKRKSKDKFPKNEQLPTIPEKAPVLAPAKLQLDVEKKGKGSR